MQTTESAQTGQATPRSEEQASLTPLLTHLIAELRLIVSAKIDALVGLAKSIGLYIGLGVLGLALASGILLSATLLFVAGIALGINALFGWPIWAGFLLVGGLITFGLPLGAWFYIGRLKRGWFIATKAKYDAWNERLRKEGQHLHDSVKNQRAAYERECHPAEANGRTKP